MAHPEYEHIGTPETLLIEECSELIKALCKVQRFGWDSYHPFTSKSNMCKVREEIDDVLRAIQKLENLMRNM